MSCVVCQIANGGAADTVVWQNERLMIVSDIRPIRRGHVQIIPHVHVETFDALPEDLLCEIMLLGGRLARDYKPHFGVSRVGFAFTGNEVPHVHAHVLPLHAPDDITSARFGNGAVHVSHAEQVEIAHKLRGVLSL